MMLDKFYQLDIAIPTNKIKKLFDIPDRSCSENYLDGENLPSLSFESRDINISVAPDGWVILFVVGSHGNHYEIVFWQAQEIEANFEDEYCATYAITERY